MKSPSDGLVSYLDRYFELTCFLIPVVTALFFILISNHVWEDYLITFRYSRNLAEGNGLVYQVGERVHGFTSFFNTMIPAVFDWAYKGNSIYPALWGYRIVSILVLASACVMLARMWRLLGVSNFWILLGVSLVSFDAKIVDFSTNGQEVAFMVFFISWAFLITSQGLAGSAWKIGACAAGLLYSRPDGCLYAAAIFGFGILFFSENRLRATVSVAKGALLTLLLYAPWILFVWWYYGSPIPNTITAKVGAYTSFISGVPISSMILGFPSVLYHLFAPVYDSFYFEPYSGAIFTWISFGMVLVSIFVARKSKAFILTAVTSVVIMVLYLTFGDIKVGMVFPWYLPAVGLMVYMAVISGMHEIEQFLDSRFTKYLKAVAGVLWLIAILNYGAGLVQMTTHQRIVENGVRKATGLWLAEHAKSSDTVHSEPIGYIGFFSGLKIYDWPGLQSPKVVEIRHLHGNQRIEVIQELMPDWLVLRPLELIQISQKLKLSDAYEVAVVFDKTSELDQMNWIPGNNYHYFDCKYYVLRKTRSTVELR